MLWRIVGTATVIATIAVFALAAWAFGHPRSPPVDQHFVPTSLARDALRVQYFGTTTLLFRDGANAVMIDGFLSRPGLWPVLTNEVATDCRRVADTLKVAGVGRVDLLLTAHSHYDHALDAPFVAAHTGAVLAGSTSTAQIARGAGLPASQIRVVRAGERLTVGRFRVTIFASLHPPDDRVPGTIDAPLKQPAAVTEYREGGSLAFLIERDGLRAIVHPNANCIPGMCRGVRADMVFLATAGLGGQSAEFASNYWREVVVVTGARVVMPIHWDDFLRPLDEPLVPMPRFRDDFADAIGQLTPLARSNGVSIRYMPVLAPVDPQTSSERRRLLPARSPSAPLEVMNA